MSIHRVMISSTLRDLPEHRQEVLDACLRQKMFPLMMEHLPARPEDAIRESLKLVDEATLYLGIFGHRYGHVPAGHSRSITEMEYDRAVEIGLPRLIFLVHEDHLLRVADVEQGEGALRLKALKERLQKEQVVAYFRSPADLRAHVINSLSDFRRPDLKTFHFVSDIPVPPEPYVAHPYTLMHSEALVGRQSELNLLTDWVTRPSAGSSRASILALVALGGMGKSAVTWKWFQDIAPQEMTPLEGRLWWSFYETDATFENFVIRALAYVARISRAEAQALPAGEREERLLNLLDQRPFLLVLDGLERLLVAYARLDALRLPDDDLDEASDHVAAGAWESCDASEATLRSRHRLRKTADPRAGSFLRKLSTVRASRVLVSTRLYPAELQTETGREIPGARAVFLSGLTNDDALTLWRSFGVSGSRDVLVPLFRSIGNYPLLIRALAGEVSRFRRKPGDFQAWLQAHPDFDPFGLPLVQRKSHILAFALRGLGPDARKVLLTLSAFRMPTTYDTLVALLVGPGRTLSSEAQLDAELSDLEDRGLVGWDRRANRYDLHPIVRGVTWHGLGRVGQRILYRNLQSHFESIPSPAQSQDDVESLDDLSAAIELFNTLVGLERYDEAYDLFHRHMMEPALYRLGACRESADWLEMLFPDGIDQPSALSPEHQKSVTWNLAYSYYYNGNLQSASHLWKRLLQEHELRHVEQIVVQENSAMSLLPQGAIYNAELETLQSVAYQKRQYSMALLPESLGQLAYIMSLRGIVEGEALTRHALDLFETLPDRKERAEHEIFYRSRFALHHLNAGRADLALAMAQRITEWGDDQERSIILAANTLGEAFLATGDLRSASAQFFKALQKARVTSYLQEEIISLIGLSKVCLLQEDLLRSRELLEDARELIERGPFRLLQAAMLINLAAVHLAAGDREAAIAAAQAAYRTSWCDGPPYSDYWGLEAAERRIAELGGELPANLPHFNATVHKPMPRIDLPLLLSKIQERSKRSDR